MWELNSTKIQIQLPPTRFSIGEEFKAGSVNCHSSFQYVKILEKELGMPLFTELERTFLGPILKAASRINGGAQKGPGLGFSGKLVHFLVTRQIVLPSDRNELGFYFNYQPMKFSLREFHLVTGLPCSETAEQNELEEANFDWPNLQGAHTMEQVLGQIKSLPDDDKDGKIRLSMLLLLENIFLMRYGQSKSKFPAKYLQIAKTNIKTYPWGRLSFELLKDSVNEAEIKDKIDLKGFPMALQLWFLASVPKLEEAFTRSDSRFSGHFLCEKYAWTQQATYQHVLSMEEPRDATVKCVLFDSAELPTFLDDEEEHDGFGKIVELVTRGYILTEHDWMRGFVEVDASFMLGDVSQGEDQEVETGLDSDHTNVDELQPLNEEADNAYHGDQSSGLVEDFQLLNFQDDEPSANAAIPESSSDPPPPSILNSSSTAIPHNPPPYKTRYGRQVKETKKYFPNGHKTKSQRH